LAEIDLENDLINALDENSVLFCNFEGNKIPSDELKKIFRIKSGIICLFF
jgi:hypothetical protein